MRRYALASPEHKQNIDLRNYEDVIVAAVKEAMKNVDGVSVVVHERYYEVSPSPGRGAAIAIGRAICKSDLGKCCIQIPKLFSSREVSCDKEEKNEAKNKNRMGGYMRDRTGVPAHQQTQGSQICRPVFNTKESRQQNLCRA